MIASSQQIKDCTTAAYDYLKSRSDKNSVALQKQLQSLSLASNLEMFEPSSSETLELYMCLEKFLTQAEAKSTMVGKVLTLLTHISESCTIRDALRDNMKVIPVLSNFLVESKLSKDNHLKTLNLLSITSYKIKIAYLEGWIMELVPFLTATVTKGIVGDESLLVALQILANLCRSNPQVVEYLRHLPNNKMLLTTLSRMKNATMYIRLLVLEVVFFVHPKLSEAIFSNNEIVDMIFTVAIDGFEENRVTWLQLAADVFEELAVVTSLEPIFREYQNYGTHLQLLVNRMTRDSPELLAEALMNFMCCLVKFNHQDIKSLHEDIFINTVCSVRKALENICTHHSVCESATLPHQAISPPLLLTYVTKWINCHGCGQTAMQVVRELLAMAGANTLASASMDTFVEAIKMSLTSREDSDMTPTELQHIIIILGLVDHISTSNEAVQLKLAWKLEPSLFSNLLKRTLMLHSHCLNDGQDDVASSGRSSPESSGYDSISSSKHGMASCLAEGFNSRCDLKMTLRKTVSKAVILILAVMKGLGAIKSEHLAEYRKMMGLPVVMSHLMWGGQSGLTEYVTRAWSIISDGSLSKECLEALVAATEESPSGIDSVSGSPTRMLSSHSHMASAALPVDFEEKVETLIARLGGTVRKMEVKDCPLTDVMNLYEYKLASLVHSEESLRKALIKADIQNRQTSLLHLRTNIQNDHLRGLLAKWESGMQKIRAEKAELQTTIKEIEESSRQFKNNFINEKDILERKVKDLKKELIAMEGSFRATEEKNAKLQHQLSNKVEEIKKQQNIIQKEQEKGSKLSKQVQKLEEEMKQSGRSLEALKKEIESLENIKLQLNKENGDLEMLVKNKDEALAAKEEELEEALIKVNKMLEIQNMIHDISSRRVVK
ncbi:hypothetical protein O3P69_005244 [Scylla paramamosain]|uniref:CIP2A N-terminal domain-containing protein n=1 Tax=Scylla paramamosain TaxID=85552 RepID=A0AAW0U7F9_SCYPA